MAAIINASIDVTKIDKSKLIQGKKGKYLNLTVSVNDEVDDYGNNASIYIQQSKEERQSKADRQYLGNGRVVWNNGNVNNAESKQSEVVSGDDDSEPLPF